MPIAQIIALAVPAAQQLLKAIESANNGDADAANKALEAARTHFSTSLDAWNATKAPTA